MISRKIIIISISIVALVLATAVLIAPSNVQGQMTIPTRTPKPDPTDDNGGGDNGGGDNGGGDNGGGDNGGGDNQQPTSEPAPTDSQPVAPTSPPQTSSTDTPPPGATHTPVSTTTGTVVPIPPTATPGAAVPGVSTNTPVPPTPAPLESILPGTIIRFPADNEPFPEAEPCGQPPTFTANDAISVREGPSSDYPLVGLLGAAEVRPIVGRAAFTHWWVIQLERNGRLGWVDHEQGKVHGLANRVTIVSAPDLDGVSQAPRGTPWIPPTPQANCPAPELLAAAAAAVDDSSDESTTAGETGSEDDTVAGAGNEQTTAANKESPPSGEPDSLDDLPNVDQPAAEISERAPLVQTSDDSFEIDPKAATSARSNEADLLVNELAESAPPLTLPGTDLPQLSDLMPVAAAVLVLLAVAVGLFAKRAWPRGEND